MFYSNFKKKEKKKHSKPQAKLSSKLRFQKVRTDWEHKWKGCMEICKYGEGYISFCNVAYSCEQDNNVPLWSSSTVAISWKDKENLISVGDDWQMMSLGFFMAMNSVSLSLMKVKTDSLKEVIWSYKLLLWREAALILMSQSQLVKQKLIIFFQFFWIQAGQKMRKRRQIC